MNVNVEIAGLFTMILLSLRLAVLVYATPMDAFGRVPGQVKLYLTVGLAALLTFVLDIPFVTLPDSAAGLAIMFIREATVGLMMAFGLYAAFGAFMIAGRILDFQAGFGAANLFNPATNDQNPLLGTLLTLFATLIFFVGDYHHLLLKGVVYSIQLSPLGMGLSGLQLGELLSQFGAMFTYGVVLVAPVVGLLLFLDAGIGVMSRTMPQMNVYFLFLPLKVGLGLVLLAVSLPYMSPVIDQAITSAFKFWQAALV